MPACTVIVRTDSAGRGPHHSYRGPVPIAEAYDRADAEAQALATLERIWGHSYWKIDGVQWMTEKRHRE